MYMYIHMHVYVYISISIYACTYTHTYIHIHLCMYLCIRICLYIHTHACTHTHMSATGIRISRPRQLHIQTSHVSHLNEPCRTCVYVYPCIHTHTHTHTSIHPAPVYRDKDMIYCICTCDSDIHVCVHVCIHLCIHVLTCIHQYNQHLCIETTTTADTKESCLTYEWVMSHVCIRACIYIYTHININATGTSVWRPRQLQHRLPLCLFHRCRLCCSILVVTLQTCARSTHIYIWTSRIHISDIAHMNESCHTYERVMSHLYKRVETMKTAYEWANVSCHTYDSVMLHTSMSHIAPVQACRDMKLHMDEWMCHVTHTIESCHTCPRVMSHISMSHIAPVQACRDHDNHGYEPSLLPRNLHVLASCECMCTCTYDHMNIYIYICIIIWICVGMNPLFCIAIYMYS